MWQRQTNVVARGAPLRLERVEGLPVPSQFKEHMRLKYYRCRANGV